MKFVITIDGPAGAGKSTIARMLAEKLGVKHLSSGKIYRIIAFLSEKKGLESALREKITLEKISEFESLISSEAVGRKASEISRIPEVRERVNEVQREIVLGSEYSFIVDGRDEGTVVFPDADIKIYLDASLEERAKRKALEELKKRSVDNDEEFGKKLSEFKTMIEKRDRMDTERDIAPLRIPPDAIYVDTTGKTPDEVLSEILEEIKRRKPEILRSATEDLQ